MLAGRNIPVGRVTAWIEGDQLYVKYSLDAPWVMSESHLDIQNDWQSIPQTSKQNPIPGHFRFKGSHTPTVSEYTYQMALPAEAPATFYIAAHAEVARTSSPQATEGAWGAGTRFTERGNWATYFKFTPTLERLLEMGNNWALIEMSGIDSESGVSSKALDTEETYFHDFVYVLGGDEGIHEAPLPEWVKVDLLSSRSSEHALIAVSRNAIEEIERQQQRATPGVVAQGCHDEHQTRTFPLSQQGSFTRNIDLGDGASAFITVGGGYGLNGTAEVTIKIKKQWVFCYKYGVEFERARVYGTLNVDSSAQFRGGLRYNRSWSEQLVNLPIGSISFWIFRADFSLRVDQGFNLNTELAASVSSGNSHVTRVSFDYTCTPDDCDGTVDPASVPSPGNDVSGGVDARVRLSLWVQGAVQADFYAWLKFAHLKVGVRPAVNGDLWAYYGNGCGDADANGQNEVVQGATFDLDAQVSVPVEVKFFRWRRSREFGTLTHHIAFWDLLGSSALEPMLGGPASIRAGQTQAYTARMRPCWPYSDSVDYSLNWGDGNSSPVSGPAATPSSVSHTWQQPGTALLSLRANSDSHGRALDGELQRSIQIEQVSTTNQPPVFAAGTPQGFASEISYDCQSGWHTQPVSYQLVASDPEGGPVSFSMRAADGSVVPGNVVLSSSGAFSWNGQGLGRTLVPGANGSTSETLPLILTARDGAGGSAEWQLTLQAIHLALPPCAPPPPPPPPPPPTSNLPPVFTGTPPPSLMSNIIYDCTLGWVADPTSYQFTATDPEGGSVSFSLTKEDGSSLPGNVTLSPTGAFSWNGLGWAAPPIEGTTETLLLILRARDGQEAVSQRALSLQATYLTKPDCPIGGGGGGSCLRGEGDSASQIPECN